MSQQQSTPDLHSIAQRLETVEQEMAELKRSLQNDSSKAAHPWYLKHAGIFADDSEFQEVVRLGREIRQADRLE